MAFGLLRNGAEDRLFELMSIGAATQQGAQVEPVVLTQAQIDGAISGEADAVAGFAKVLRYGCDEAYAQVGTSDLDVTGRATAGHDAGNQLETLLKASVDGP